MLLLPDRMLLYKLNFITCESHNLQLMMGSSRYMVAWQPIVKLLVFCKPEAIPQMKKIYLQSCIAELQNLKGVHWHSHIETCHIVSLTARVSH